MHCGKPYQYIVLLVFGVICPVPLAFFIRGAKAAGAGPADARSEHEAVRRTGDGAVETDSRAGEGTKEERTP